MSYADGLQNVPQPSGYFCDTCGAVLASTQDFQAHMSGHHQMYSAHTSSALPIMYATSGLQSSKQSRAAGNGDAAISGGGSSSSSATGNSGTSSNNPVASTTSLVNAATQPFTGYVNGQFSGSLAMLENPANYGQFQSASDASVASDNLLCLSQVAVHQLATQSLQEMLLARRSAAGGSVTHPSSGSGQSTGFAAPSAALNSATTVTQQPPQQQQQRQLQLKQQQHATPTFPAIHLVQQQQHQPVFQLQPMTMLQQQQQQQLLLQQHHPQQQQHNHQQQQQQHPSVALNVYSLPAHLYGQQSNMTAVTSIGTLYSPASSSVTALNSSHAFPHHHHSAALVTSGAAGNGSNAVAVSASGNILAISGLSAASTVAGVGTTAAPLPLGLTLATQPVAIPSAATVAAVGIGGSTQVTGAGDRALVPRPPSSSAVLPSVVATSPATAISPATGGGTSSSASLDKGSRGSRSNITTGEASWCVRNASRARRAANSSRCDNGGSDRPPSASDSSSPAVRSGVDILAEATKQVLLLGDLLPPAVLQQQQQLSLEQHSADPTVSLPLPSSPSAAAAASTADHSDGFGGYHCAAAAAHQQQQQCQASVVMPPVLLCCQFEPISEQHGEPAGGVGAAEPSTTCHSGYVRTTLSFAFAAPEAIVRTALEAAEPRLMFRCRRCQHESPDAAEAAKHVEAVHLLQPQQQDALQAACVALALPGSAAARVDAAAAVVSSVAATSAAVGAAADDGGSSACIANPPLLIDSTKMAAEADVSLTGDKRADAAIDGAPSNCSSTGEQQRRSARAATAGVEQPRAYQCTKCGETLVGLSRFATHRRQCLRASARRRAVGCSRSQKISRPQQLSKPRSSAVANSSSSSLRQQLCVVAGCCDDVPQRERAAYWACHRLVSASGGNTSTTATEQQHAFVCHLCCGASGSKGSSDSSGLCSVEGSIAPLFGSWRQCLEHLLAAHEPSTRQSLGRFRCGECRMMCSNRQELNRHAHERHSAAFPQWACPRCGEQSFGQESFDAHVAAAACVPASAASVGSKNALAEATPDSLDASAPDRIAAAGDAAHAEIVPASAATVAVAKPRHSSLVTCRGCGKKFLNDSRLQRHLLTNACSPPVPRVYRCDCCSKSFARRGMLINHKIWCLYQTKSSELPTSGAGVQTPASGGSNGDRSSFPEGNASGSGDTTTYSGVDQDKGATPVITNQSGQFDVVATDHAAASALDSLAAAAIAALRTAIAAKEQTSRAGVLSSCRGTSQPQEEHQPLSVKSPVDVLIASTAHVDSADAATVRGQMQQSERANQTGKVVPRSRGKKAGGGGIEKRRYKCTQANCFTMLGSEHELSVHRQCHTKDNHELLCYKCSFVPTHNHWFPLKEHFIAMHEGTLEAKFKCITCGKGFAKQKKYSEHLKIHSEDKTYQCAECGLSFKQQCSLRHHVIVAHADPVLKEAAANESALRKKPADEKKAHLCHICGYSTDSGSYFTTHMNIHKGVKPYSCQYCTYESVDRACFKRHMWRHKSDKPYKCSLCSYAGIQKAQLVAHMKTKHPSALGGGDGCEASAGADGLGPAAAAAADGTAAGTSSSKGQRRGKRQTAQTSDGCGSGPAMAHYPAATASVVTAMPVTLDAPVATAGTYRILSVLGTDVLMPQGSLVLAATASGVPDRMGVVLGGGSSGGGGAELSLSSPAALLGGCLPAGGVIAGQTGQHHMMQMQLPDYLSTFYGTAATAATTSGTSSAATPNAGGSGGGTLHTLLL